MNLTLTTNEKLSLNLAGSSVTKASLFSDLRAGNIKSGTTGRAISIFIEDNGIATIVETVNKDYNGNGSVDVDDQTIDLVYSETDYCALRVS